MIVVSDTSSISALLRTKHSGLLKQLYGEVLIPEAVHIELQYSFPILPNFFQTRLVNDTSTVQRLNKDLDLGEAEAIALAKELNADLLLIDEHKGRRIASREGIPIIGLMGVLLDAKRNGLVLSVRKIMEQLESTAGFRLSQDLKTKVILQAGESQ